MRSCRHAHLGHASLGHGVDLVVDRRTPEAIGGGGAYAACSVISTAGVRPTIARIRQDIIERVQAGGAGVAGRRAGAGGAKRVAVDARLGDTGAAYDCIVSGDAGGAGVAGRCAGAGGAQRVAICSRDPSLVCQRA